MQETDREWKLPKNVRQIGEAGSEKKIYVEDYVNTFLEKLAVEGKRKKALLFGEVKEKENMPYIFIDGALEMESFSMDNEARGKVQEEIKRYFDGKQIVGWFLSAGESPFVMRKDVAELYRKEFPGENQTLIVRDSGEKETFVFLLEEGVPTQQAGYYLYYEKNTAMREYMVERNRGNSVEKEMPVKDEAIKRFRRIIKSKDKSKNKRERPQQPAPGRFVYMAGSFLVVTVLALGATMVYNYDRMKEVEESLARLTNNVDSQSQYLTEDDAAQVMLHIEGDADVQEDTEISAQSVSQAVESSETASEEQTESAQTLLDVQEESTEQEESGTSAESETDTAVSAVARASYTVKTGDTLAAISEMYYGNSEKVEEICTLNGIDDENTILPGQKILLP